MSRNTDLNKGKQALKKKKLTAALLRAFKMLICNMTIKRATQDVSFNNGVLSAAGDSQYQCCINHWARHCCPDCLLSLMHGLM